MLQARDAIGRNHDPERRAIAAALKEAAGRINAARTQTALRTAQDAAIPYVEQAQAWEAAQSAARAAEAAQAQRRADEQRRQRELDRRARDTRPQHVRRSEPPPSTSIMDLPSMLVDALAPLAGIRAENGGTPSAPRNGRRRGGRCPGCLTVYPSSEMVCGKCDRRVEPIS